MDLKISPAFCRQGPLLAGLLAAVAGLDGCGSTSTSTSTTTQANPFSSVVILGDSISAGFQNDSLLDTQQPNGWASLVATQASFSITLPLIAAPGVPAVLKLVSLGPPIVIETTSGSTTGRDDTTVQPTDLAVPGHKLHDLINHAPVTSPTTQEDYITQLVLGYPSGNTNTQLAEAIALKPATIFVWIGNNDAIAADGEGTPSAMTSLSSFTSDFTQLMSSLKANTSAHLVVANIVDPTTIPYMSSASQLIAQAAAQTGLSSSAVSTSLGIASGDLVNAQGLVDFDAELNAFASTGSLTPLADSDVLTAAEILTVQSTVSSYNQVISTQVAAVGGTLVDMHAYSASLSSGITINGYTATSAFLGGLFSLDGVHPTNTGYALLANQFIQATNAAFNLSTPRVDVSAIAAKDPYFGITTSTTSAARIPTAAALRTDQLLRTSKQHTASTR